MFQVGNVVGGRFRVDRILGAGGMGVVAAATHLELGHRVAIKVLREELAENATIVERFIREARAVVNLRTEHVCRVFDVGRLDSGAPYIVMEMLDGSDLQQTIAKRPLPANTAVDYVLQACVALAEAHAAGIVHRDLKPANLFVTRRPDGGPLVKVLDFGIAKALDATGPALTQAAGIMGSPGYMSPEQLQSARDVDARTDIWALGVTLYQLVSGRMPFPGATLTEIAIRVAADPPAPLDIDRDLAAVIFRCLEKPFDRRTPTVVALAAELVRFASSDGRRTAALAGQLATGTVPAPPPFVPITAPTAMSMVPVPAPPSGHSHVPAGAQSQPTSGALPRRSRARWLFGVGALVLVGASVAITLAMTRSSTPANPLIAATPGSSAVPAVAPPSASATAGSAVDYWAPVDAGVVPDAAPAPHAAPILLDGSGSGSESKYLPPNFDDQVAKAKEEAKESCKQVVSNPQLAAIPMAQMQIVMCWCMLGERARAKKIYDTITDKDMRTGAAQLCKYYGAPLPAESSSRPRPAAP